MGIPKRKKETAGKQGITLAQRYQNYLGKDFESYNNYDLIFYFADVYKKSRGTPYFINGTEDAIKMRRLQSGFDNFTIVKLINYVIENVKDISIGMLCSTWVNQFIRNAGINHPEHSKYEMMLDSPFLTKTEREVTNSYFDKMVFASDNGDIHGEIYWKDKLEGIGKEIKRRKELLSQTVEE